MNRTKSSQQYCLVLAHYAPSAVNFRAPLIRDLVKIGINVRVLAPDWSPDLRRRVEEIGAQSGDFPVSRTGLNPLSDLRTFISLWCQLGQHQPDVVLSYAAKTNVWGMLAAKLAGVPHRVAMVEGMGYAFTEGADGTRSLKQRLLGFVLRTLYRIAFRAANTVLVLNPDDARDLQNYFGLSPEKTIFLGGIGVPLEEWPLTPPHLAPITFTLIARMLREKGIFEFLQAAERIKRQYPTTRFCLLGGLDDNPGAIRAEDIQAWVEKGIVEWPGQVDVKPWLATTSVFVLPSYYREGVPRSTQEAMAMGRPVITTDVPGCRETVIDGENGFLIPARNVDALADAMIRFIENPSLIEDMGQVSRTMAVDRFDIVKVNQKLISALGLA